MKQDVTDPLLIKKIKLLRIKSILGLALFAFFSILFFNDNINLKITSIIGIIISWLIFSKNHTEIAIIQLQEITKNTFKKNH